MPLGLVERACIPNYSPGRKSMHSQNTPRNSCHLAWSREHAFLISHLVERTCIVKIPPAIHATWLGRKSMHSQNTSRDSCHLAWSKECASHSWIKSKLKIINVM